MRTRSQIVLSLVALLFAGSAPDRAVGIVLRIPASYRSYDSVSVNTSQWVAPLIVSVPLNPSIDLIAQTAAHSGSFDDGEASDLTGITDTQVGLAARIADGRLLLQASASFPTGVHELDTEQQRVALALAPPFLGYRVRQAGRGTDLGAGITYAFRLARSWAVGLGAGHLRRGSFTAIEGGSEVHPGAETRFSAGIDGQLGALKLRLDGTRRIYGEDEGEGIDYEEPAVWEGSLALGLQDGEWGFDGGLLLSRKEEGETGLSPYSGTYLAGAMSMRRAVGASTWLGLGGEFVRFRGEEEVAGGRFESTTGGIGPLLILPVGRGVRFDSRFLYLFGELDDRSIDGFDAQLALTIATGSSTR